MNSKEALEKLVGKTTIMNDTCASLKNCIKGCKCRFNEPKETCEDYKLFMIIKQDLDRLEKLEEENKQLKAKLDRSLPKLVIRNTLDNVLPSLEEENEKLKQALDILKRKNIRTFMRECLIDGKKVITFHLCSDYNTYNLTQEEYDLLKEVLLNEKED